MSLQQYVTLALQLSIVCIVFSLGLMSTMADLLFLWRRPGLLLRSLVAMLVVMPVVAVGLTQWLDVRNTSEIALVAMAISPMPPLLPRREVKAGGLHPYAVSLLATLALLAIVTIPVSVGLLAAYYRKPLTAPASAIARLAFFSVLLPLSAGIAFRAWTTVAVRLVRPASQLGTLLLVTGSLLLLSGTWRGIWGVIGDGSVVMVAVFVVFGLVVGRLLGGPDPRQATVLGLSTACRHPAITLSIASANFPDDRFGATVLLYLLVGLVLLAPYVMWSRVRIASGEDSRTAAASNAVTRALPR
jgi:bile acid:Na+ symporter, BASS family